MQKFSRSHVASILAIIVGALGFGQAIGNPQFFQWIGFELSGNPVRAIIWITSWLISPALLLISGASFFVPRGLSKKVNRLTLTFSSALFAAAWVSLPFVFNYGINDFQEFLFLATNWDGSEGINVLSAFSVYSAPAALAVLGLAISLWVKPEVFEEQKPKTTTNNSNAFKTFLGTLLDSKLENFISRKVSGVLYIITAWILIVSAVFFELAMIGQIVQGNALALLGLLLAPVALLLLLVVVRMAFEAGIALIVIAENTKK